MPDGRATPLSRAAHVSAVGAPMTNHIETLRRDLEMPDHEYLTLRDAQWSSDALGSQGIRVVIREMPLDVAWIVRELEEQLT